jgi:hypothetical protein
MSQPINETQAKDISEARTHQTNLLNHEDKFAAHFLYWFSWFWSTVSTAYFFAVTFLPIPKDSQHFADIILGFLLGTAVATILGYFFGNSKE